MPLPATLEPQREQELDFGEKSAWDDLPLPSAFFPKIPSADEIFGNLAPKKSAQKYDVAWTDFLSFLNSPHYSGKLKPFVLQRLSLSH